MIAMTPHGKLTVVVIDDDETVGFLLGVGLGKWFDTVVFQDPVQALRELRDLENVVIVCDLEMPNMTGIDVHSEIVRRKSQRAFPLAHRCRTRRFDPSGDSQAGDIRRDPRPDPFFGRLCLVRILPISDVHIECHEDGGDAFFASLQKDVDVLVVAGDVGDYGNFGGPLETLASLFSQVVYVHGNHECYDSSLSHTKQTIAEISDRHPNFHFLDNDLVEIGGHRILGTTLWFKPHPHVPVHGGDMNDFHCIEDLQRYITNENAKATSFLAANVRPGDIVVTHHAPSWRSEDPRWKSDPLSRLFYVCDLNELIMDRRPALWIHGHIHFSWDYALWATRVVCNPVGYLDDHPNTAFSPTKVIEV